jgi:Subtilase family/Calx-beta domain
VNGENLFRAPLFAAPIDFLSITPASAIEHSLPSSLLPAVVAPSIAHEYSGLQTQAVLATPINIQANQQARSIVGVDTFSADPRFANLQGQSWTVAVIDTGINPQHSFFGTDLDRNGVADRIIYQYDFADGDNNAQDLNGHGSQTTSIVASQDATLPGIAPAVNIISLKVFNDSGESDYRYVKQALEWVNANADRYRISTVLMALGENQSSSVIDNQYQLGTTLAALADRGVIAIASAGNDFAQFNGQFGLSSPANDPNVIAVGAVYNANLGRQEYRNNTIALSSGIDRITPFSQRTPQTIFAPGAAITGAGAIANNLLTLQGSSQAAAYVAGAAVVAQQLAHQYLGHSLTGAEFQQLALATGVEIKDGDDEDDNVVNTGGSFRRLDLFALANKIWQMRPNENQPLLSITTNQNLAWENGQNGSFLVNRTGETSSALSFNYRLAGTATNGQDYQSLSGTGLFLAGQNTAQITVVAIDDAVAESGETVKISLVTGNGYQLAPNQLATLAIVDNDSVVYSSSALEHVPLSTAALVPNIAINNDTNLFRSLTASKLLPTMVTTTIVPTVESIAEATSESESLEINFALVTKHVIQDIDFANDLDINWLVSGLLSS